MITLNMKKFAESEKEFTESLFSKSTCVGFARRNAKSITIMDHQKQKIGVINKHGLLCSAKKIDGKYWYSFADIPQIGKYEKYSDEIEEPKSYCKWLRNS